jgi:adenylate cyclase
MEELARGLAPTTRAQDQPPLPSRVGDRAMRLLLGPPLPGKVPERVTRAIEREQERSEVLVTLLQLTAVAVFGLLYAITPKAFPPEVPFEPVPVTLGSSAGSWRSR